MKITKVFLIWVCVTSCWQTGAAKQLLVKSPNEKIAVSMLVAEKDARYRLAVDYYDKAKNIEAIKSIDLGLILQSSHSFDDLVFLKSTKPVLINEHYTMIHGKKTVRQNAGREIILRFENRSKQKIDVILRVYNDGIAFRYALSGNGTFVVEQELTAYRVDTATVRWTQKWNPANEGLYANSVGEKIQQQDWCYPALFQSKDSVCWFLLHESDLDGNYCGTKLNNKERGDTYKLAFPDQHDGRGQGKSKPQITLPWKSPWRVIVMGSLANVVESTLVDDVASPSSMKNHDWIKPGAVSWNYWSDNHGTKDFKTVCDFADLAVAMGWPYTLLDWEWDAMGNGGNLTDALKYIHSKGIKPLMWYNSGGDHTWVGATPKDRMLTHTNRMDEFAKLKKMGVAGVKIDFFESEKQDMIQYYLGILEDAAKFDMLVYFHGCLVPRGWARTYPHLMTYEAVRGAEWYNNGPEFTAAAPVHNTIIPFTRNVVGSMDYTPVTFTNSQYPHLTSYGHELALSVIFESALQHFADRPQGYYDLPDAPKKFLQEVPSAWDQTLLLGGYPGKDVTISRKKNDRWYIGVINGENKEKRTEVKLDFLDRGRKYRLRLITDGKHDKELITTDSIVDSASRLEAKMLRRGGFVAVISPIE